MARKPKYGPYNYQRILGQRNYTLETQVTDFVKATIKRMDALAKQSTMEVINDAQTPVAKGGKMRVDTSFLRASGKLSLTGIPTGESVKPTGDKKYTWKEIGIASFKDFKLGMTIHWGWTANYAEYREAYDGFLISALQKWPQIVTRICAEIEKRSPANKGNTNNEQ